MADPQYEEFVVVFHKLPQHIKATPDCYRLVHDVLSDNDSPVDAEDVSLKFTTNVSSEPVADESPVTPVELPVKPEEVYQASSRRRRKLPQIPTGKRPLESFSLADEIKHSDGDESASTIVVGPLNRELYLEIDTSVGHEPSFRLLTTSQSQQPISNVADTELSSPEAGVSGIAPCTTADAMTVTSHRKRHVTYRPASSADAGNKSTTRVIHTGGSNTNNACDSGNSTGHSPNDAGPKSPDSAVHESCSSPAPSLSSCCSSLCISSAGSHIDYQSTSAQPLRMREMTHRVLHRFTPRHNDELALEIGDGVCLLAENGCSSWCEGINLRTGKRGIFPNVYITDADYNDFDSGKPVVKRERFMLNFLGSLEVSRHKGDDVLCSAIRKILRAAARGTPVDFKRSYPCILEVSEEGLRMCDRRDGAALVHPLEGAMECCAEEDCKQGGNAMGTQDIFFSLKNVTFCGYHPTDHRYFGFVTKHPVRERFACHVFSAPVSTREVAESVGNAFQRFYQRFMESLCLPEEFYFD